jgi:hypothetical protein
MKKIFALLLVSFFIASASYAQILDPIEWSARAKRVSNTEVEITLTADIEAGWHLYGTNIPEGGPYPTAFYFYDSTIFSSYKEVVQVTEPEEKFDPNFGITLQLHDNNAVFSKKVTLKDASTKQFAIYTEYQLCNDVSCLPPNEKEIIVNLEGAVTQGAEQKKESKTEAIETAPVKLLFSKRKKIPF